MRGKSIIALLGMAVLLIGLISCRQAVTDGKKNIVVTYSVMGALVKDLAGDSANIIVPMPNGLDPHEWEPSARDIETINRADLVVENGLGLEGGMLKTLDQARGRGVKFFTASDFITIRRVGAGEGIPTGDLDQQAGAPDPHIWTDPLTMKNVIAGLNVLLKTNYGMDVSSRAANIDGRLDGLDKQIADMVSSIPAANRKMVTGHESMGYFAQRYNFKLVGVIMPSLSTQAEVSASDLAALKKSILDNHVKVIFAEVGTSPAVARAIAGETGARVVELTTHALPEDGSYFTFMLNMAKVITSALK